LRAPASPVRAASSADYALAPEDVAANAIESMV